MVLKIYARRELLVQAGRNCVILLSEGSDMVIKSVQRTVDLLDWSHASTDLFVIYASVAIGILACITVYHLNRKISAGHFKSYSNLPKSQQIEWNNRSMSTFHAIYITAASLYFVLWSNLYSYENVLGPITHRSSKFSAFSLGVSAGYFLSDLGMIIWFYPSLGGMEYVVHHLLSVVSLAYTLLSGESQIYTFMVLISESTTPWINLRWYLDVSGLKSSGVYLANGIIVFLSWLVARILLFMYMFYHACMHFDQLKQMRSLGIILMVVVPPVISVMNLIWFVKIFKGLKKTLARSAKKKMQ